MGRAVVIALLTLGCVDARFEEGYVCGPGGECPPGQRCGDDGRCHRDPAGAADAGGTDGTLLDGASTDSPLSDGLASGVDGGGSGIDAVGGCQGLVPPTGCTAVTCAPPSCPTFTCTGDPRCFLACDSARTFDDAEDVCVAWGGHLASIPDASVNGCVSLAIGAASWLVFWQDGAAGTPSANWHWLDGAPEVFQRWAGGQPNDVDGDEADHAEQCAMMENGSAGMWRDESCGDTAAFVCARTL